MRRDTPPIYDDDATELKGIALGKCPLCGGEVTFDMRQMTYRGLLYRKADGFMLWGMRCENGCDLTYFHPLKEITHRPFRDAAIEEFRGEWVDLYRMVRNPKPCGRCGVKPKWTVDAYHARLECPRCHRGYQGKPPFLDLGIIAQKWDGNQNGETRALDLEARLNGCGSRSDGTEG